MTSGEDLSTSPAAPGPEENINPVTTAPRLRARGRLIIFDGRPLVMGIVNVNDDSFSGDGTLDFERAWQLAARQVADGADMVDVGAESARTNRPAIEIGEEVRRFEGMLHRWRSRIDRLSPRFADQLWPPLLSINAWRPEVVGRTLPLGGDLLNDIGGMQDDRNARLCANHGVSLLVMHTTASPKIPQTHVRYPDVVAAIEAFFVEKLALCAAGGLASEAIVLDPGLDFAKQRDDNLRLIGSLSRIHRLGRPLLLPVSRKTFIGETLALPAADSRDAGTIAALVAGQRRGADIFRVHNARAAAEAVRIVHACL